MENAPLLALLFIGFFAMIAFRVPVAIALALAAVTGMALSGIAPSNMVNQLYRGLDSFVVLAVPFYLGIGFFVNYTSIGQRLLQFSALIVGRIAGSTGHINVLVSMLFAGISGSATADTSGVGAALIPMMLRRGYSRAYAAAITAISSTIGSIIPPSIIMILYGAYTNTQVSALFLGGIVPGVLLGLIFMVMNYVHAKRRGIDIGRGTISEEEAALAAGPGHPAPIPLRSGDVEEIAPAAPRAAVTTAPGQPESSRAGVAEEPPLTVRTALTVTWRAVPALLIPLVIVGGLTGGIVTATEAGMLAMIYLLVLVTVFYREVSPRGVLRIGRETVRFYALPLLAAGEATVFGFVITLLGVQGFVRDLVLDLRLPGVGFLLVIIAVFLIVGTFLDAFPAIVLFAPMFVDGALALGIHPVHLGLIVSLTLSLGLVTPPYGLCLLVAGKLADTSMVSVARALIPFWAVTIALIILIALFPDIVLAVPKLFIPRMF